MTYYDLLSTEFGNFLVCINQTGFVSRICFQNGKTSSEIDKEWIHSSEKLKETIGQLRAYFSGERKKFDLPLAPEGTPFQKTVWKTLNEIPFGEIRSYQEIAETIGKPKASRAVGLANSLNPIPIIIPCHRVIGKNGKLTGYAGGMELKEKLLIHEGVLPRKLNF